MIVEQFEASGERDAQLDAFLTVSQVATMLNLAEPTVRQLIRDGKLPSLRLSEKIIRVPASGIISLIRGGDV